MRAITKELVDHPFFPILFIGEFIKQLVEGWGTWPPDLMAYAALAIIATGLWVLSDAIDITEDVIGEKQ